MVYKRTEGTMSNSVGLTCVAGVLLSASIRAFGARKWCVLSYYFVLKSGLPVANQIMEFCYSCEYLTKSSPHSTPPHPYLFNYSGMDVMGEISLRHWLREGFSKLYQVNLFIIGSLNISD